MRARVAVLSLMVVLAAACGAGSEPFDVARSGDGSTVVTGSSDPPGSSSSLEGMDQPPDLIVAAGAEQLVLSPFSYCWFVGGQGVCVDGIQTDPLPSLTVDDGEDLSVEFPLDWQIQATLLPGGDYCDGSLTVDVDPDGSPVETLGSAGTYRVELFGRGDQGDAAWAFELTTTDDRPSPPLSVQVLWYPSGQTLDAEAPFSAHIGNLTEKPAQVSAVATVTSSNGSSQDFELTGGVAEECWGSTVSFDQPANLTSQVLELGPSPYDVELTLRIEGQKIMTPVITWPDDFPSNSNESSRIPIEGAR